MKTTGFKGELAQLLAKQSLQVMQLNVASQLTAIDIYVGDDHMRIACRIDSADKIMEDVMKLVRIPGDLVMCHESIELDSSLVDYTKWPLISNRGQLTNALMEAFGLCL